MEETVLMNFAYNEAIEFSNENFSNHLWCLDNECDYCAYNHISRDIFVVQMQV